MKLIYKHNLSKSISYKKIDNFLIRLQEKYKDKIGNPNSYWNLDHTRMFFSVDIVDFNTKGMIHLNKDQIVLEGELPFLASMFSGTIKKMIKEQFEALLSNPLQQKHL